MKSVRIIVELQKLQHLQREIIRRDFFFFFDFEERWNEKLFLFRTIRLSFRASVRAYTLFITGFILRRREFYI